MPQVFAEVTSLLPSGGTSSEDEEESKEKGSPLDRFIELVSSIIHPILWPLAGVGLFKAFLQLFLTLGWLNQETTGYVVLNAASDSLINFLPMLLAIPAAKRFKANQFTAVAIAGALVYPDIIALNNAQGPLDFFGIPLVMMSYVSSLLPIIVGVWVQGYLERFLAKHLPSAIRNFTVPLLSMLIMVPLILLTIGPATTYAANGIASGVDYLFVTAPWLAGAIMGAFWQVFVIFGLHWGLVPIMMQQLAGGFSILAGPLLAAVLAQAAATLAVALRTKDPETKKLAGPASLSGFLAGITEPAIYGVNLPRKLPFYFGVAGGAIGGMMGGIAGAGTTAFVFPSLIGVPAYLSTPNLPLLFGGVAIAVVVGFTLTYLFGVKDPEPEPEAPATEDTPAPAPAEDIAAASAPATAGQTATATLAAPAAAATYVTTREQLVTAPMSGEVLQLADVPDPVFASGAMGKGLAITPSSGTVFAPVSGKLIVTMGSGHAYGIRTDDGLEVLIHVGLDTVNMKGAGFTPHVAKGDQVEAGQVLAEADLAAIEAAGHPTTTVMVITNTAAQGDVRAIADGSIHAGQTALIVTKK